MSFDVHALTYVFLFAAYLDFLGVRHAFVDDHVYMHVCMDDCTRHAHYDSVTCVAMKLIGCVGKRVALTTGFPKSCCKGCGQ